MTDSRPGGAPIRVLVVGALPILDSAMAALLAGLPGIEAAVVLDGAGGRPDLALLVCPDPAELEMLAERRKLEPDVPVICLAVGWTVPQAAAALSAGAAGCLSAADSVEALAASLRQVARAEVAVSSTLASGLIAYLARAERAAPRSGRALTGREREILAFVCQGMGNKEIAQRLYLSLRTVENHLAAIYSKLGVGSRTEAAVLAVQAGLATGREANPDAGGPRPGLDAWSTSRVAGPPRSDARDPRLGAARLTDRDPLRAG